MPTFWVGSVLANVLATPEYGLQLFPGIGSGGMEQTALPLFTWFWNNLSKLILPILVLSIHSFAILALQMRGGVLDILPMPFIWTARAKGASESVVYWRHALRNALFPVIAVLAAIFPAIITGSVLIEYIFDLPGMGMAAVDAFNQRDYPVLFGVMMLGATLTVFSNIASDMLYHWVDPRVRFEK